MRGTKAGKARGGVAEEGGSVHAHPQGQKHVGEALLVGGLDGQDVVGRLHRLVERPLLDRLEFQAELLDRGKDRDSMVRGLGEAGQVAGAIPLVAAQLAIALLNAAAMVPA